MAGTSKRTTELSGTRSAATDEAKASEEAMRADKAAGKAAPGKAAATGKAAPGKAGGTRKAAAGDMPRTATAAAAERVAKDAEKQAAKESQAKKAREHWNPYYGLMFMFAWFFCAWFMPDIFTSTDLLDFTVTSAWLIFVFTTAISLWVTSLLLGHGQKRKKAISYLSDIKWADKASVAALSLGGLLMHLNLPGVPPALTQFVVPVVTAFAYAVLWILWGECYARMSAIRYSDPYICAAFAVVVLVCLGVVYLVPPVANAFVTAIVPILSLICLTRERKRLGDCSYPRLLPASTRVTVRKNLTVVGAVVVLANMACYYTLAIIPLDALRWGNDTFTLGVAVGALAIALIALLGKLCPERFTIFRLFPWMLAITVAAGLIFLSGDRGLFTLAFVIALSLSSVYAILLIMYSGILTKKGYLRAGMSFAACGACVYGGIFLGNSLAVFFEQNAGLQPLLLMPVTIVLLGLLTLLIVPFMREEVEITKLMAPAESVSDLDAMVEATGREFGLSKRELEILGYLARGFSTDHIAKELVISSYTVQTHVQHIYTKTGIHKRSELLSYVMRRGAPK